MSYEHSFTTPLEAQTEIINLRAIQQLPKATEHFITDLHGEFESVDHILRNCSGVTKVKVKELFDGRLSAQEQSQLCFYIYYPEETLLQEHLSQDSWKRLLLNLVELTRFVSSKYTRSKVRKSLPEKFSYILDELIFYDKVDNKEEYYDTIVNSILDAQLQESFALSMAYLIQSFVVDHLHVLGDIYDRGPFPDKIMDRLMKIPSLDIQLGNHDIIWMGAYCGSLPCLANVIRISLRYGHVDLLEKGYGIDLTPLRDFGRKYYEDLPNFVPRLDHPQNFTDQDISDMNRMQQAITIIQFKLEAQVIKRRPEFKMDNRRLLNHLSPGHQFVDVDGKNHRITNGNFQLVDYETPEEMSLVENLIVQFLLTQFQNSQRLAKHVNFLAQEGTISLNYNNNLLLHGCVPVDEKGKPKAMTFEGRTYQGLSLINYYEDCIQRAFQDIHCTDCYATDILWYMWCGENSSLFGKKTMRTFERYYIEDASSHYEVPNPYYELREDEDFCISLLKEFNLDGQGYIINGHTPVKQGEKPIKANGKMLVIDGGFAKPYQKVTGIAGYTLVDNSHMVYLVSHYPFTSKEDAIANYRDILPKQIIVHQREQRAKVKDTTIGENISRRIAQLKEEFDL